MFPSVEIPPQPGVDRDVQCHVPSSNGSQWVLCHLAGQLVLRNRGEEYRMGLWTSNSDVDQKTNQRYIIVIFLYIHYLMILVVNGIVESYESFGHLQRRHALRTVPTTIPAVWMDRAAKSGSATWLLKSMEFPWKILEHDLQMVDFRLFFRQISSVLA